ncbi:hypothetical protein [Mesorhizobium sp.]|uniref:hypothetical protein n=1 Tax=Mesorhizobium sp. TaxID=1871066 RepID=UPI003459022A
MRMSSRRGKRAALMYDRQPIIDHLRTISDPFGPHGPAIHAAVIFFLLARDRDHGRCMHRPCRDLPVRMFTCPGCRPLRRCCYAGR